MFCLTSKGRNAIAMYNLTLPRAATVPPFLCTIHLKGGDAYGLECVKKYQTIGGKPQPKNLRLRADAL